MGPVINITWRYFILIEDEIKFRQLGPKSTGVEGGHFLLDPFTRPPQILGLLKTFCHEKVATQELAHSEWSEWG